MIILLNLQFSFRKGHTIATAYCVRIAVRIFIGARDCFIAKGLMKPEVGFYSPSSAGPYQMCLPSQIRNKLCVRGKPENQKAQDGVSSVAYTPVGYVGTLLLYDQTQWQSPLGLTETACKPSILL